MVVSFYIVFPGSIMNEGNVNSGHDLQRIKPVR